MDDILRREVDENEPLSVEVAEVNKCISELKAKITNRAAENKCFNNMFGKGAVSSLKVLQMGS